ncbi:cbb3-type cytochrome c oxidase subunit I [Ferrimicrobium sp.]|uniref:cytochrome c oxidase subunit I n=1 Tax=Ferrimicrobium sp. TaxID=2926050 RepID=UPI002625F60E|nr:cbb3-type cytochrome c oxidase subunit I [Ferrimicrobium sp.]
MAIDMTPAAGVGSPTDLEARGLKAAKPWFTGNMLTAFIGGAIGYAFGHWLGNAIASNYSVVADGAGNEVAIYLSLIIGCLGWFVGLGALNYPIQKLLGLEPIDPPKSEKRSFWEHFTYSTDHKVVGVQYLFGMLLYFLVAGLLALGIRTELLSPVNHIWAPDTYIEIVGEHGTMMMMMMTSVIMGPFGNYLIPLMIGSKKMAFPRLEATSFWFTVPSFFILLSALWQGGFQSGWTGYAPLSIQGGPGQSDYDVAFALMALSMVAASINMTATIINYRAPGMRWSRMPILAWGMITVAFTMLLSVPVLFDGLYVMSLDRGVRTAMLYAGHGGSSFLWENLFWFFGHPEVYLLALPGFALTVELLPVFARKPIFALKTSTAGLIGVAVLSFFVWQHHLFMSGMNPDMRPLFMLTTELISIPTGFLYLVAMGTVWRGKIRFEVPMLFLLAVFWNFLWGGVTGVYNSDVPVDALVHGSFFVMAHFHFTIMGQLIFAVFAGVYYYVPLIFGIRLNDKLGKISFWIIFVAFNSTFLPLFMIGLLGQPRRVFEYALRLQHLNQWVSVSSYVLGFGILLYVINLIWSLAVTRTPAGPNPWESRGLEWQVGYPVPRDNFEKVPVVLRDPYGYGTGDDTPVADLNPVGDMAAVVTGGDA